MTTVAGGAGRRPVETRLIRQVPAVRLTVAASVALGMVSTAAVVAQALTLGSLIAGAMPHAGHLGRTRELAWLAAAILVRGAAAAAGQVVAAKGSSASKTALRSRLARVALSRDADTREASAGDVASVAGRGMEALDVYVGRCIADFVLAVAAPVALAGAIGALDWVSLTVILIGLALFPVFGALVGRATSPLAQRRWEEVQGLSRRVLDVFEGMAVIRAYGRSSLQRQRIADAGETLRKATMDTLRLAFLSAFVLDELASVSVALVAVPLGLRLVDGTIRLSAALSVLVLAPEVFLPLRRASAEFHQSAEGLAAASSIMDLLDPAAEPSRRPRLAEPPDPRNVPILVKSVSVTVPGRDRPVLDSVEFRIEPGETVCVVGPNGSGKSTVVDLLAGFLEPTSGSITVGGVDLAEIDLAAWRKLLAYLPERPTILAGTLRENLSLADPDAGDAELAAALVQAGGYDLLISLPEGLDTHLGDGGRPTSAGERQRIAIARTFLRPAGLYLLDEPTEHLDETTERDVIESIGWHLGTASALIVTHRPAVLALADRVVEIPGPNPVAYPRGSTPVGAVRL
ncbi:MAG: thiol reductant ABC exporter subunit CydD [Acidimicrobiales bacterium]